MRRPYVNGRNALEDSICGWAFALLVLVIQSGAAEIEIVSRLGSRSDYTDLQTAFGHLQSGDTLLLHRINSTVVPGYTDEFQVESDAPLQISNLSDVSIFGVDGISTISGSGPGDFLFVHSCTNVRIQNIRFNGNRPGVTDFFPDSDVARLFSMIILTGTNCNVTVNQCEFIDYGNHAVSHLIGDKTSEHVSVTHCRFENGGDLAIGPDHDGDRDGAAVSGMGSHWVVAFNTVVNCVRGFEVENGKESIVRNIQITGNRLIDIQDVGIMVFATNLRSDAFVDLRIAGNQLYNNAPMGSGILVGGGTRIAVSDNHVRNPARFGISVSAIFSPVVDASIDGNMVSGAGWRGIQVASVDGRAVDGAIVRGNTVSDSGHAGIWAIGNNITVSGNHCHDNGNAEQNAGIKISSSTNCFVIGNRCWNSAQPGTQAYGILVSADSTVTVSRDNFCHGNSVMPIENLSASGDFLGDRLSVQPLAASLGPVLVSEPSPDGKLTVKWPADGPHARIESAEEVANGSWREDGLPANLTNSSYSIRVPYDSDARWQFFRLRGISNPPPSR